MKLKLELKTKIILYIALLFIFLVLFICEIAHINHILNNKSITYSKKSNISYITYLKDNNNHYSSNYLKNEYNLVASLIDYFSIDYNYSYTLSEKVKYDLTYSVNALLEVYDSDNDAKPIEKRNFVILEEVKKSGNSQTINVDIFKQKIDYETYNSIVQEWKKEITPNANLKVQFKISWSGKSKTLTKKLGDDIVAEFLIPISQKTIDIKNPQSIDETGIIKSDEKVSLLYMVIMTITGFVFAVGLIYLLIYISNLNKKKKSKYEQKINKILREFDRAITEVNGKFEKKQGKNYIEVKDFMELLDVHDNINEPIIYYKNTDNISVFVIKNSNDIYYCQLKRKDFDN